jgi:hypothetical protein
LKWRLWEEKKKKSQNFPISLRSASGEVGQVWKMLVSGSVHAVLQAAMGCSGWSLSSQLLFAKELPVVVWANAKLQAKGWADTKQPLGPLEWIVSTWDKETTTFGWPDL